MIKTRLAKLRRLLAQRQLDALLVTMPANRRHLSGFLPDDGQFGETSGSLLITQNDALLLTDFRYELSAREQAPLLTTHIYHQGMAVLLAELLPKLRVKTLGFEPEALLVAQHGALTQAMPEVVFKPAPGLASSLRVVKHPSEAAAIEAAGRIMEQALEGLLAGELAGRTERDVALELARAVEDLGGDGLAFPSIVASGPMGAEPHAEPGQRVIGKGEPVIIDVGARLNGYNSDMTRTVAAGGLDAADPTFREVYAVVRRAQLAALEGIRPGMTGAEADALARKVIDDAGHGARFGHSLGHGVGLLTHEAPSLSPRSSDLLLPGMVFTVEPGVYLPGWGGVRLEVMVELGEDGCRVLGQLDWFYDLA